MPENTIPDEVTQKAEELAKQREVQRQAMQVQLRRQLLEAFQQNGLPFSHSGMLTGLVSLGSMLMELDQQWQLKEANDFHQFMQLLFEATKVTAREEFAYLGTMVNADTLCDVLGLAIMGGVKLRFEPNEDKTLLLIHGERPGPLVGSEPRREMEAVDTVKFARHPREIRDRMIAEVAHSLIHRLLDDSQPREEQSSDSESSIIV